jgi:K+/H+ antiporter YhaU regulatory subunit KhtT
MKKTKRTIEGEGIIIKTDGEYRFRMRIGKILQSLGGREVVRISEEAKSLTELQDKLRKAAKRRARELGIGHIINLNSESFY